MSSAGGGASGNVPQDVYNLDADYGPLEFDIRKRFVFSFVYELPAGQEEFLKLNLELAEIWPNITEKKDGLPDADEWAKVEEKKEHLSEEPGGA